MSEAMRMNQALPVGGAAGKRSTGWWGVWSLIVTEGALFGYLLFSYLYLNSQNAEPWPPEGKPDLPVPGLNTAILLGSSLFIWLAERCIRGNRLRLALLPMVVTILLGTTFVGIQAWEWKEKSYGPLTNLYGSLYYTITAFHMAHVVVGLIILLLLMLWTYLGFFDRERHTPVAIGGLYWHFVDVIWLCVFTVFYLLPYV